jgi:hypothetical protein
MSLKVDTVLKFLLCFLGLCAIAAVFMFIAVALGRAALMMVIGPCIAFSALMDYDWFMNNYKAIPLVKLCGREGARMIYIVCGIVIFATGVASR